VHFPDSPDQGAYSLLRWLEANSKVPQELRSAAGRLTTQVTEDHELPYSEDPLNDAETIVIELLGENAPPL
jgi:hypothetical protein